MLYSILKLYASFAIRIFCPRLLVRNRALLQTKGPLLLAVNHPNSFLDAVILDILFKQPVYSLARGDAFNHPVVARILRAMKILPVYREREGKEHLHRNYDTFDACTNIFRQGGIVLIFTEALCENEWHLRPLKKGTARLAATAWQQGIPLQILPIGLNYSSFRLFGKNVHVNIGQLIVEKQLVSTATEQGKRLNEVTRQIEVQLKERVYEIDANDRQQLATTFEIPVSALLKLLLAIPALLGVVTHCWLYVPVQRFAEKRFLNSGHYDSIVTGILFLAYPFYLLLWTGIGYAALHSNYSWLVWLAFPFFAWSYVWVKRQVD